MRNSQNGNPGSNTELFEKFPFLQSFPFDDYEISLEKKDDFGTLSGIDPVVISEAGTFVSPDFVNFNYQGNYTKIHLSFYTYDIQYIHDIADKIKRLDATVKNLDQGLVSDSITDKIKSIKSGERFLKKLGASLIPGRAFDGVLDDFLASDGIKLTKALVNKIKSKSRTLTDDTFDESINKTIRSFYDIHLHHIKVLLGVVIASKVH